MKIKVFPILLSIIYISTLSAQSSPASTDVSFIKNQEDKIGNFFNELKRYSALTAYKNHQSDVDRYFQELHNIKFISKAKINKKVNSLLNYSFLIEETINLIKALDSLKLVNPNPDSEAVLNDDFYQRIKSLDASLQKNVLKMDADDCNQKLILSVSVEIFADDICNSIQYDFDLNETSFEKQDWLKERYKYWHEKLFDWGYDTKDEIGIFLNVRGMMSPDQKIGGGLGISFGGYSKNKVNPFNYCDRQESFFKPSNWTLLELDYNLMPAGSGVNHIIGASLLNMRWSWFNVPFHINILQMQHANGSGGNTWFYTPEIGLNWRNFVLTAALPVTADANYRNNPNAVPGIIARGVWRIKIK